MASGPLAGYRIVDLTSFITGPLATMWLGDQGADVIKVEQPGSGDVMRSTRPSREQLGAFYLTSNRNKRSIVVNLKQPAGSALVQRLAETADVFVQNFRPGVADRLGLGEHHLREKHPRLIYVSISGFGESGPLAGRRVYDTVVQAFSGMAVMQGTSTDAPHMVRTVIADKVTAQTVCQGITAALLERERSGEGQHIHISMLHAMIAWLWPDGMSHFTFMDGDEGSGRGGISQDQLMFHAVDGMLVVAAVTNAEWHAIARAIERPELGTDARFATPRARAKNHEAMRTILAERFQTATTAVWQRRLADEGAVFAPVNTPRQVIHDEQVIGADILFESEHPLAGPLRQPRHPVLFDRTPACDDARPAPALGEHTTEILRGLAMTGAEIERLREQEIVQ